MKTMLPSTSSGPPTPAYIFRGHQAAIHALHFFHNNVFFASGDSDGWIVIWRLSTRRPAAVWKAHDGGIMGIKDWNGNRLLSHGRDHKLRVWQLRASDFECLSTKLPVDGAVAESSKQPWLLHTMPVNALNFCAFATCTDPDATATGESGFTPLLLAEPNGLDSGGIDIFQLPSEQRVSKIQSDKKVNTGMVMSLRIFHANDTGRGLILVAGYEDGQVMVLRRKDWNTAPVWVWDQVLISRAHTQPVLSLDVTPDRTAFITSSADAILAKFAISTLESKDVASVKTVNTKHAGQQDLKIRSDGRVFATAGWDRNIRVYSAKSLKELALLKWHQEGCYAVAFAEILPAIKAESAEIDKLIEANAMTRMKQEREAQVHDTHWLVAGSKDGKISLWDIY